MQYLIAPLLESDGAELTLWRAVSRVSQSTEVLEILGTAMAEKATDRRLGRETRQGLVFGLIVECLHAFRENRSPALPNFRVSQMIRTVDDELRAFAANAIQVFVRDLSAEPSAEGFAHMPDELFRTAVVPLFRGTWPEELSLVTPGVSGALANLPAACGEAFAEAVDAIARFLVPFQCWSMVDYGLHGGEDEANKLALINDEPKAKALLKLLDLTVGQSEGAVIPHDLTDALDQISHAAPRLEGSPVFRRLAAAARR